MAKALFPACEVRFPLAHSTERATFYLAAEEYVAHQFHDDNYLFSWILPPTVVMGRNQVAHQEFDLDYCERHGIDVVRRKSGGGAIFADDRNIMWSLVTGAGDVESIFKAYAEAVAAALSELGAPSSATGRNDIVLENGGKVCGNAFYHMAGRNIVHGTMLYDTNFDAMQRALKPAPEKLKAKGVQSVRRRIGLLKDYINGGTMRLRENLTSLLTDRHITLTSSDVDAIKEIETEYRAPSFVMGHLRSADEVRAMRIEGCGMLELRFSLSGSTVSHVQLNGDFFEIGDAESAFNEAFCHVPFTCANLQERAAAYELDKQLRGLSLSSLQTFLSTFF